MQSNRFSRLAGVELIGPEGLDRLQASKVAVVGVGNLGGEVARHLAQMGISQRLVDRDVVKTENLGTQGFTEDDIGLSKVAGRARFLSKLNSSCGIEIVDADLRDLGMGALHDVDLIFSCLDSRPIRAHLSEIATRLAVPWVDAGLDGSGKTLVGRVACYDPRRSDSPCYLCSHDQNSLREMMREGVEGCPRFQPGPARPAGPPTIAISALGSAVAATQVVWGLQLLLGRAEEVVGKEVHLDLQRGLMASHVVHRNRACLLEHRRFNLSTITGGRALRVAETFSLAEQKLGPGVKLNLHHRSIATGLRCETCKRQKLVFRVRESLTESDIRCECGEALQPLASDLLDRFRKADAQAFGDRTWEQLGLPANDVVSASKGRKTLDLLLS